MFPGDDRLHLFAQAELFLVVLAGYILFTLGGLDATTDGLLSAVMITMTVALLCVFGLMACKSHCLPVVSL